MRLSAWDCEELAANLAGIEYDECEDEARIWAAIYEKYEIDGDDFANLINDLLPFIQVGSSLLLDGKASKGFGKKLNDTVTEMFIKIDV